VLLWDPRGRPGGLSLVPTEACVFVVVVVVIAVIVASSGTGVRPGV
jgi:hypothetical protein